jgi:hypothetical protein
MNTNTDTRETATDDQTFTIVNLGEGNWEMEAPNGVWTITATSAMTEAEAYSVTADDEDSFHVTHDTNHHHPEGWTDTFSAAIQYVETNGVDRRRSA